MAKKRTMTWPADQVKRWPIEDLAPYERNARVHSKEQVAQIAKSIEEFGFTIPILIDEKGVVIAGHGRLEAAKKLKLAEVPVMIATGWTDAQRRAYTLADNAIALNATWDDELLTIELGDLRDEGEDLGLTGFDDMTIARLFGGSQEGVDAEAEWQGMPEFDQQDKRAFRSLALHFKDQAAVDDFAKLINQKITDKTRFVWFPEIEIETYADKRYVNEE